MRKKTISLIISILLIATAIPAVGSMNNYKKDLTGVEEKTCEDNYVIDADNMGSPPVITVTDPLTGVKVVFLHEVHVIGYVTDDIGINGFGYVIEYPDGTAIGPFNSINPPVTYYPFDIHENVKAGANYLKIEVTDVDGNTATEDVIILFVKSRDIGQRESLLSNPLPIALQKNKLVNNPFFLQIFERLIQRFPLFTLLL